MNILENYTALPTLYRVSIKTLGGDYIIIDVNGVKDLLLKLKEYKEEYSMVYLYDINTEEKIKIDDKLKDGQELFMVVLMVDVQMDSFFEKNMKRDDPEFYINVEIKFICDDKIHKEGIFYYPMRQVIIEEFICCNKCEYRDEYKDLESYLEKRLNYPEYQKKLAIREAVLLWNKLFD